MVKEAKKEHDGIAEVKHFIDKKSRQVRMFSPIDNSPKLLVGITEIQLPDGSGRRVGLEFRYPPGTGLVDAFSMYDQAAESAKKDFMAKQKSVVLGPDGRPLKQAQNVMDITPQKPPEESSAKKKE